jgi:hypothetical protein
MSSITCEFGFEAHPRMMPRLSANEVEEESDYMNPFTSGHENPDIIAKSSSSKGSIQTKTTTSSISSPNSNGFNFFSNGRGTSRTSQSSNIAPENGRSSPDPIQSYYSPISEKGKGLDDEVKDLQVGGERRLFVVNAGPEDSDEE